MQHLHFLGICGTFMGSLAVLAKQLGYRVTGSDLNVYPPMSTQLEEQGIEIIQGYHPEQLSPAPGCVIIGNAMSRGNPCVEYVLEHRLNYRSGPQWLSEVLLSKRHVIALSGTHGKTTTTSMVTHCLTELGLKPGYLIGGVPKGLDSSASIGDSDYFVIEADEYDTAFFDKRSKFVHYHPKTLVINNLEYDHADIFPDLAAIQRQFHHVIRTVPQNGLVIAPETEAIQQVLDQGVWCDSEQIDTGAGWQANLISEDGSHFDVLFKGEKQGEVNWCLIGQHNVMNGLAAVAAVNHATDKTSVDICQALSGFEGVKRRLEKIGEINEVTVYDDFAHHPTAIETTLQGLRKQLGFDCKITAVIEPRSNTMVQGVHQNTLADSVKLASQVFWFKPKGIEWSLEDIIAQQSNKGFLMNELDDLVNQVSSQAESGEHIVIMSNGGFGGFHSKLLKSI